MSVRRNPARKARPYRDSPYDEPVRVTRSMAKTQNTALVKGLDNEQAVKKVVYRTV